MGKPISVELLDKYLYGKCTEAEIALVKEWYRSFEHDDDHISDIGASEERQIEQRIYAKIIHNIGLTRTDTEATQATPVVEIPQKRNSKAWYGIAAAAAILLMVLFIVLYKQSGSSAVEPTADGVDQVDITNGSNRVYKATLPDNSMVWLKPGATLKYPKVFGGNSRTVSMSGECFFEVTKNAARPFIINSSTIITKVWGTRFLVRDNLRSDSADVSVMTGKVSVSIKHNGDETGSAKLEKGEIMLYPHQKVVYMVNRHILKPLKMQNESALQMWNQVNLSFDNKPLGEIIPVLNAKYHVHIKAANSRINHYMLHADFNSFNLPDVLEALKKSINVSYEIKEDNIIELR